MPRPNAQPQWSRRQLLRGGGGLAAGAGLLDWDRPAQFRGRSAVGGERIKRSDLRGGSPQPHPAPAAEVRFKAWGLNGREPRETRRARAIEPVLTAGSTVDAFAVERPRLFKDHWPVAPVSRHVGKGLFGLLMQVMDGYGLNNRGRCMGVFEVIPGWTALIARAGAIGHASASPRPSRWISPWGWVAPRCRSPLGQPPKALAHVHQNHPGGEHLGQPGDGGEGGVGGEGGEAGPQTLAAVAEGRVVELIEYQDGRGFLLEARRRLQDAIARQPGSAAQLSGLQTGIEAMLRAFPGVQPPERALLSPQQLEQLQQRL